MKVNILPKSVTWALSEPFYPVMDCVKFEMLLFLQKAWRSLWNRRTPQMVFTLMNTIHTLLENTASPSPGLDSTFPRGEQLFKQSLLWNPEQTKASVKTQAEMVFPSLVHIQLKTVISPHVKLIIFHIFQETQHTFKLYSFNNFSFVFVHHNST